jgi:signal transduction histidine kinase
MLYVNYELREALVQIEYSNGIILNSERTLSLLKDAETGVRGYVYAEDTSFLLPYHQSKALLPVQLDSLSRLLRQNKKDKYQVEKFRTIIYNRLLLLDSVRYLVAHDAANRYKIINIMAQGRLVMDKTRGYVQEITEGESAKLRALEAIKNHHAFQARFLQGLLSLISVGLLGAAFWRLAQESAVKEQYQQELKNSVNRLEEHTRELEHFNYVMAHQLQEPLRKIGAFSDRLNLKYGQYLPEEAARVTKRLHQLSNKTSDLIEELRMLMGLQRYNETAYREKIDLNIVLQRVKHDLRKTLTETHGTIAVTTILPVIYGHRAQIALLFHHLLENALRFHQPGTAPSITICHEIVTVQEEESPDARAQKKCKILFSDQGIGFDMEFKDKIFEMFQRLDPAGHPDRMGTGLAFCKKIVQYHNGSIEAFSTPGIGTTFVVLLPMSQ